MHSHYSQINVVRKPILSDLKMTIEFSPNLAYLDYVVMVVLTNGETGRISKHGYGVLGEGCRVKRADCQLDR